MSNTNNGTLNGKISYRYYPVMITSRRKTPTLHISNNDKATLLKSGKLISLNEAKRTRQRRLEHVRLLKRIASLRARISELEIENEELENIVSMQAKCIRESLDDK